MKGQKRRDREREENRNVKGKKERLESGGGEKELSTYKNVL